MISDPYTNKNGQVQCDATGSYGEYVIRKKANGWVAIQLFGTIGCIVAEEDTPEKALATAEKVVADHANLKPLKLMVEISGFSNYDLELALNEVLRLVTAGDKSGIYANDKGSFSFSVLRFN